MVTDTDNESEEIEEEEFDDTEEMEDDEQALEKMSKPEDTLNEYEELGDALDLDEDL